MSKVFEGTLHEPEKYENVRMLLDWA